MAKTDSKVTFAKWTAYSIAMLVLLVAQNTLSLKINNICLLLPAIVIIAMNDDNEIALVLGGVFGLLWDMTTGNLLGYNALILILFAITVSFIAQYMLRVGWLSNLIVILCFAAVYEILIYLFFFVLRGNYGLWYTLIIHLLRGAFSALVNGFLIMLLFNLLRKKLIGIH